MRPSALFLMPIAMLLASVVMPAAAQQRIYQWRDPAGRTHYSSTPPGSGHYTVRGIHARDPEPATAASAAAKEPPQCAPARRNLGLLKGEGIVQIDSDGDGKPDRALSATERAAQAKVAESILAADCMTATATPGGVR